MKVSLPGPASQIACGDNHTVVLMQTGEVFTFGKHQEGQLGRKKEEGDNDTWHCTPRSIAHLEDQYKVTWVGARGNQTFISVDESLVSEQALSKCRVFANSQAIGWSRSHTTFKEPDSEFSHPGLVPPTVDSLTKPLIVISRETNDARKWVESMASVMWYGVCVM